MTTLRILPALLVLLATAAGTGAAAAETPPPATPTAPPPDATIHVGERAPIGLEGGAESFDALAEQFLAAVYAGDTGAMHRLRLSKDEYVGIIVPGEVPKGQPPRATFQKVNDVFFGMLDSRSRYAADAIVSGFKGKSYPQRRVELSKGVREFAWYTAHGEVRIVFTDAQGLEHTLRTGWVAEVDGRFKFIGFNWDD